jgi:hypothetical protein
LNKYSLSLIFFILCACSVNAQTIGDLLERLNGVAYSADPPRTKESFAKLYRATTLYVDQGIGKNYYSDDDFIISTEVKFGDAFFVAINDIVPKTYGWSVALNDSLTKNCNDIQRLLLAINAHINDDLLPTLLSLEDHGNLLQRKADMDKAGVQIMKLIDTVFVKYQQHCPKMSFMDRIIYTTSKNKIERLILKEREAIWNRYIKIKAHQELRELILKEQFEETKVMANKILYPKGFGKYFLKRLNRKYAIPSDVFFKEII